MTAAPLCLAALALAPPALAGPPGKAVDPPACRACGDAIAGADAAAAAALARWETASEGRVPVSKADRAAARHDRPGAPAELLALAASLSGPVNAADLAARYRWTAAAGPDGAVRLLHAAPADPLARVFTPRITVALTPAGAARSVTAENPHGPPHTLALAAPPARVRTAAVIRGQSPDPVEADAGARRVPVRTALFTASAGSRAPWRLDRARRPAPTALVRAPLTAPRPR